MRVSVLTISDSVSAGENEDRSGPALVELVRERGADVVATEVVSDDTEGIMSALKRLRAVSDMVLTTGGTGLSARDNTYEATSRIIENELVGFGEVMRMSFFQQIPTSILSRATAGTSGSTLIVNLPGSEKAVRQCLPLLWAAIAHAVEVLHGTAGRCGG